MTGKHRAPELEVDSTRGKASAIVGVVILVAAAIIAVVVLTHNDSTTTAGNNTSSPRLELGASASGAVLPPPPSPTPSPTATPASPQPKVAMVPAAYSTIKVSVYNTSSERGLATAVAKRLLSRGWAVRNVSGVSYAIKESTVFYDPPGKAAALWMAAHDETVRRALPRPNAFLPTGGLIVAVKYGDR